MRRILIGLAVFLLSATALWAPTPSSSNPPIVVVSSAPTGRCTSNEIRVVKSTGDHYSCIGSTWTLVGGGGASTFDAIGTGTNTAATMTLGSGATLDVQGGTLRTENLNAVRYMDQLATGGTGVDLTNRWTGWWSSLAANTTHRFPKGYYGVNDGGGGGAITIPAGATIECDPGAIFSFSAARTTVANMFNIAAGSDNITIRGCAFEPGTTVPAAGLSDGTGGSGYLVIGAGGDTAVSSNIRIEGNRFGIMRYSTSSGWQINFHEVDGLHILNNSFDASRDSINNRSVNSTAQHTPSNVFITGNNFSYSQVEEDFGGVIQLGTGTSGTYETIGSNLVIANNVFQNHNGTIYLNHRWDGVTITGNVARSDVMDQFMLPGVCSPVSVCSTASSGVVVSGNTIMPDTTPGDGTLKPTGSIRLNATGGATITGNTLLGDGRIEINAYDSAVVPDWAKGPYTVVGNTVNRLDRTTSDTSAGGCVEVADVNDSLIANNVCVNTGQYGIHTLQNSRAPTNVAIKDNLIIDRNVSTIYASAVDITSCVKCVVTGNVYRGPVPTNGVVYGATADDVVYGNTLDPSLTSAIPFVLGPGTNNDIPVVFDQGTGTDPRIVWDDNPGQFEFDFDASLNDGTNPRVTSSAFVGALTGNVTGTVSGNAGTVTVADAADDTTTWPLLGTSATGSLAPATDSSLTYDASTGALTATTFVGALSGNADTATTASGLSCTDCVAGDEITLTDEAQGAVAYFNGTNWIALPPGTDGQYLETNGAGANPSWTTVSGSGDVLDVGNCSAGACFDGTSDGGSSLIFYNAGGNVTLSWDGATLNSTEPISISDQGDGSRYTTFSDNTTEPSAPGDTTPDSTILYTLGGAFYKKDEGDSTNERLILDSGTVTGDVTFSSAGVAAIGSGVIVAADMDVADEAWDFGGAASLEIPNGTGPTVNAAGEIAVDTTDDQLIYYGGAKRVIPYEYEACVSLEDPTDADTNVPFFFPRNAITITDVYCEVDGGTSVAMTISDGTNAMEAITCDADGAEDDGSPTNNTFTSLERIEFDLASTSGTNTWLVVCITYTVDAQ